MLRAKGGDFQNSVCFWSYIGDLALRCEDAAFLAHRFVEGDSMDETQQLNHWSRHRTYQAYNTLRLALEEYLTI